MRVLSTIGCLSLLAAGCTGGNVVSGTLTLPAGLTIDDDVSCSDISVTVFGTGDMFWGSVGNARAEGDIASGACRYSVSFTPEDSAFGYSVDAFVRDIRYAECGDEPVKTTFEPAGLGLFFSLFSQTIDLHATASCE